MQQCVTGGAVHPDVLTIFVESLTCYRGWVGAVSKPIPPFPSSPRVMPPTGAIQPITVIRRPDWLSARLRAAMKEGATFASVAIYTSSGDVVMLTNAAVVGVGAAVWQDPKHSKPSGPLEMVTYTCATLLVDGTAVSWAYNWW